MCIVMLVFLCYSNADHRDLRVLNTTFPPRRSSVMAIPLLLAQGGGCIVNTSATAALRPRPGLTVYNASKGAVNVLTKSMAVELATDRIRVNAVRSEEHTSELQ